MAITYHDGVTGGLNLGSGQESITLTMPASTAEDDICIGVGGYSGSGSGGHTDWADDSPATWTDLVDETGDGAIEAGLECAVGYKVQGATVDTDATCNVGSNNNGNAVAVMSVFRGVDPTTPLDANSVWADATSEGMPDPASITTVTNGAWVVIPTFSGFDDNTPASATHPEATVRDEIQFTTGAWRDAGAAIASYEQVTAGAIDLQDYDTWPTGATGEGWGVLTMALRPASTVETFQGALALDLDADLDAVGLGSFAGAAAFDLDADLAPGATMAALGSITLAVDADQAVSCAVSIAAALGLSANAAASAAGLAQMTGGVAFNLDAGVAPAGLAQFAGALGLALDADLVTVGTVGAVTIAGALALGIDAAADQAGTATMQGALALDMDAAATQAAIATMRAAIAAALDADLAETVLLTIDARVPLALDADLVETAGAAMQGAAALAVDAVAAAAGAAAMAAGANLSIEADFTADGANVVLNIGTPAGRVHRVAARVTAHPVGARPTHRLGRRPSRTIN